ncbi:MAG TPA: NAD(P)-dependent oxidoreductase [Verrucomicrobiae bacterium]|jgi:3-hydroxyisobutyrate dehydrogenase
MSKPRIAFLGLGIMGGGMARRLLANGFPVAVFNRNAEKARSFAADGAQVAESPRAAASGAGFIISMVADDTASRGLWLGENGALSSAAPGTVCIECSTVTLGCVREVAAAAAAKQCEFLDAPVTGSKAHAASGELNFIVGGSDVALEKARPVLAAMSKTIVPAGPVGSGALLKIVNNFVCGVQAASLAEAVAVIERGGLNREKAMEIIVNGAPGSPLVKTLWQRMTKPDYTPNFLLRLMTKDLVYALEEGHKVAVEMQTAAAALKIFQSAAAAGHGDEDFAAVVEPLRSPQKGASS